MRSLRSFVDARLKALGIPQYALADQLELDDGNFAAILTGKRAPPIELEDTRRWCEVFAVHGAEADQLIDAMHLAASSTRVHAIVDRLEARAGIADALIVQLRFVRSLSETMLRQFDPEASRPDASDWKRIRALMEELLQRSGA